MRFNFIIRFMKRIFVTITAIFVLSISVKSQTNIYNSQINTTSNAMDTLGHKIESKFNRFNKILTDQLVKSVQQTSDSGFIVGGSTSLTRLNKKGDVIWQKQYNGNIVTVKQTSDKGFIIAGNSTSQKIWLVKTSTQGEIQWEKTYSFSTYTLRSMDVLQNDIIICCGLNKPDSLWWYAKGWIGAFSPIGDTLWSMISPNNGSWGTYVKYYNDIIATKDSCIAVCGHSHYSPFQDPEVSTASFQKINLKGEFIWNNSYWTNSPNDDGLSISEYDNGTLIMLGYRPIIRKVNPQGLSAPGFWIYPESGALVCVQALHNGGWVVCGIGQLIKYDSSGNKIWTRDVSVSSVVILCTDGGFLVGGENTVIKTDSAGLSQSLYPLSYSDAISESPKNITITQNYPNPFNPTTKISFELSSSNHVNLVVYDNLGREISTLINEPMRIGRYEVTFNSNNLACGVYIYRLKTGNYTCSKKMIVIK